MNISATGRFIPAASSSAIAGLVRAAATRAVAATGDQVYRQSQILVPVDTGALMDSGKLEMIEGDNPTAEISYNTGYEAYVEFGTRFMAAQPYLRPALDASHGLLLDNTFSEIKGALSA